MRTDRYINQERCLLIVAQLCDMQTGHGRGVGCSEIAQYARLSRQTVNSIMKEAVKRGYAEASSIMWRQDDGHGNPIMANRYTVSKFWERTYRAHAAKLCLKEWAS